jgi:hypothetical protein
MHLVHEIGGQGDDRGSLVCRMIFGNLIVTNGNKDFMQP